MTLYLLFLADPRVGFGQTAAFRASKNTFSTAASKWSRLAPALASEQGAWKIRMEVITIIIIAQ